MMSIEGMILVGITYLCILIYYFVMKRSASRKFVKEYIGIYALQMLVLIIILIYNIINGKFGVIKSFWNYYLESIKYIYVAFM